MRNRPYSFDSTTEQTGHSARMEAVVFDPSETVSPDPSPSRSECIAPVCSEYDSMR